MQQDTIFSNDILSHPLAQQVVAIRERVGDDIISDHQPLPFPQLKDKNFERYVQDPTGHETCQISTHISIYLQWFFLALLTKYNSLSSQG